MNRLLLISLAAGISAAAAFWQQQSIDSVRAATARLSEQLVQTRAALESEQEALASAHTRLQKLEADLKATKGQRADLAATRSLALPTPEEEGWWPQNRPYFYLAKTLLPKVRFGERRILMDPNTGQEATSTSPQGRCIWLSDQPFSAQGVTPHLATLLGMSDEEIAAVNDSYSGFVQGVREVEAASDIDLLRERWEQSLAQTLGADRAGILLENARRFFDLGRDELGADPTLPAALMDYFRQWAAAHPEVPAQPPSTP
jgi:hypothetical protein